MRRIRLGAPAVFLDLDQVFPGDIRTQREHLAGQRLLDVQPLGGRLAVIQATNATIGRQAGIGRNPRPGDEQSAPRLRQMPCNRIQRRLD
jgi:hypothetical protein